MDRSGIEGASNTDNEFESARAEWAQIIDLGRQIKESGIDGRRKTEIDGS